MQLTLAALGPFGASADVRSKTGAIYICMCICVSVSTTGATYIYMCVCVCLSKTGATYVVRVCVYAHTRTRTHRYLDVG